MKIVHLLKKIYYYFLIQYKFFGVFRLDVKKENILFINPSFQTGGSELVSLYIADFIKDKFNLVIVGIYKSENDWASMFDDVFDSVIDISSFKESIKARILLKIIQKIKPQVIITQYNYWGYKVLKKINKSEIYVMDILHSYEKNIVKISDNFLEYIDKRIVISKKLKEKLSKHYINNNNKRFIPKIKVIHNGIDIDYFDFTKNILENTEKKIITYIGRISEEKQPLKLIEIASKIELKDKNIEFHVVGSGPLLSEMRQKANNINNIKFYGAIPHNEIKNVLAKSDIIIMVSAVEGIPVVLLEAMAMGKVVISSDVGEIDEIIENGKNGILFKNDEHMVTNMVNSIIEILYDSSKREMCSKAARDKVIREFSLHSMRKSYVELFENITKH